MSIGLVYWGTVAFTLPSNMPAQRRGEILGKMIGKADAEAEHYGFSCTFKRIDFGTGFNEFGPWYVLRFEAFRDVEVYLATHATEKYAKRFKGLRFVDREHQDYTGRPKLWVD